MISEALPNQWMPNFSPHCGVSATAFRPVRWYRFSMFFSGAVGMRLGTAVAAIALIATPAFAADMAVKAPPAPPPAPVYNWTGFYVGGNVGYGFGRARNDFAFEQSCVCIANAFWSFNGSERVDLS